MSGIPRQEPNYWRSALRSTAVWTGGTLFVSVLGLVASFELVLTITLFDGASATDYDAGNRMGLVVVLVMSAPVFVATFACIGLLLRWRLRTRSLFLLLIPVAVWAVILIVRTVGGGCSSPLAKC